MARNMTTKATITKSTTAKTIAKASVKNVSDVVEKNEVKEVNEDNIDINEVKEVNEVKEKELRKFVAGDMIECRCVRPNKVVFYSTKTDTRYEFGGYGDINEVDYSDLMRLKSSKSPILFQPKILIEDEDLRKQWSRELDEVSSEYEGIYDTEELFTKNPGDFEKYLRNASTGVKNLVMLSAATLIKEEKLTDIRIVRIIDDVLGTQYKEFI